MLNGRKHVLISYIARVAQICRLGPLFFADGLNVMYLSLLISLLLGVFEVNGLSEV